MIKTNRTMDSTEHLEPSSDTLITTAPDIQLNLQMSTSTWKQEKVECIVEEESPCSDDTCPIIPESSNYVNYNNSKICVLDEVKKERPEDECPQSDCSTDIKIVNECPIMPFESSKYVNYYDSQLCVLDEVKKELPEDECPQSDCSMDSKIVCEDKELLKVIDKQEVKHKNIEEELSLIINQENVDKKYQVTIKTERLEEQDILDNADATGIYYDVLLTPEEVQCKSCGRIFENSHKLLNHNNGHLKVETKTSDDNEINKLHQCQYCDKGFNKDDNKLAHVSDIPNKKIPKCGNQFKNVPNFNRHVLLLEKPKKSPKKLIRKKLKYTNEAKFKCDSCQKVLRSKKCLLQHTKRVHYDYGKVFECWCGKQFRTPLRLYDHKRMQHDRNVKDINESKFQCDSCQKVLGSKKTLLQHIKNMHYDYGKVFECWCGQQFRAPMLLYHHKRMLHDAKVKDTNESKLQCDSCQKVLRNKQSLLRHIRNIHYDYGKVFECWCGKQFRTPMHLSRHKWKLHDGKYIDTNESKFQCNFCQKVLGNKQSLLRHIRNIHYDYGKVFECWCGKHFRTPNLLYKHKRMLHDGKDKDTNESKFQCDSCQKVFSSKMSLLQHTKYMHYDYGKNTNDANFQCDSCQKVFRREMSLLRHIKNMHYDYGKVFECWCGKQFRTPMLLSRHKRMLHDGKDKDTNESKFQCDSCQKVFRRKMSLLRHIQYIHYDYGKVFECWCGKQFRTPMHLSRHKQMLHDGKDKDTNESKFQCDSCQKVFRSNMSLLRHIKSVHNDYGKVFECLCGKQFRTPMLLNRHKRLQHDSKDKGTNESKFQCESCQKVFNRKISLLQHTKNIHYDYGKVFQCCCGKQFRTPMLLYKHKKCLQHDDFRDTNNDMSSVPPFAVNISKLNNF